MAIRSTSRLSSLDTDSWGEEEFETACDADASVWGSFPVTGMLVADPFLGSGSTLIAAERTGRVCVGT